MSGCLEMREKSMSSEETAGNSINSKTSEMIFFRKVVKELACTV